MRLLPPQSAPHPVRGQRRTVRRGYRWRGIRSSSTRSAEHVEPVKPCCRPGEQIGFVRAAGAFGQKLAGIPEDWIAVGAFVDREVALEHATRRAERLDAGLHIRPPGRDKHFGRRRLGLLVEAEPANPHAKPAYFDEDIGAGGEPLDRCRPARKYLFVLAGIDA